MNRSDPNKQHKSFKLKRATREMKETTLFMYDRWWNQYKVSLSFFLWRNQKFKHEPHWFTESAELQSASKFIWSPNSSFFGELALYTISMDNFIASTPT